LGKPGSACFYKIIYILCLFPGLNSGKTAAIDAKEKINLKYSNKVL
jgi:hypothetical protein